MRRLPVESARKLRWYDKEDLTVLVRTTLREKRELDACLSALKRALLRAGVSDTDIDVEIKAGLERAEALKEEDEGVASVLLASAMVSTCVCLCGCVCGCVLELVSRSVCYVVMC